MPNETHSLIFNTTDFAYRKVAIKRPLKAKLLVNNSKLKTLLTQKAFEKLDDSQQTAWIEFFRDHPGEYPHAWAFDTVNTNKAEGFGKTGKALATAFITAFMERDETAEAVLDDKGQIIADTALNDTESVPFGTSVEAYFQAEVLPHVPDAFIDYSLRDSKDGEVGIVGYEINFNRYFYQYVPPRALHAIDADLKACEARIQALLDEVSLRCGGEFLQWQQLAALCIGNSVLMVSICVALAGPMLTKVHQESGGIHWIGDTSTGKTTALVLAASVWGGEDFKRSWRATSNGMESLAVMLSDTCLSLDEINEADPQDIGAIVYCLGNGTGKSRANKIGAAHQVQRWRLSILSTGERSISAAMQENGKQAKAGHLMRLLNIPVARRFGLFDELHQFGDGRALSDHFKTQCARHFGHAGVRFVEYLLQQGDADFAGVLSQLETQFLCPDNQTARAASKFALYAMAGELAIEGGILP